MQATLKHRDPDVLVSSPGFRLPDRPDGPAIPAWSLTVGGGECAGLVIFTLSRAGRPPVALAMTTEEARSLAEAIFRRTVVEDAKMGGKEDDGGHEG